LYFNCEEKLVNKKYLHSDILKLARLKKFDLKPYLVEGYEFSEEETSEVDFEDGNENCDSICSSQSGDDHDLEFFSENF
jgi:hypothetical protein